MNCKLSCDEIIILQNTPENFKWIARDEDGELFLYDNNIELTNEYTPHKIWVDKESHYCMQLEAFEHIFKFIKCNEKYKYR